MEHGLEGIESMLAAAPHESCIEIVQAVASGLRNNNKLHKAAISHMAYEFLYYATNDKIEELNAAMGTFAHVVASTVMAGVGVPYLEDGEHDAKFIELMKSTDNPNDVKDVYINNVLHVAHGSISRSVMKLSRNEENLKNFRAGREAFLEYVEQESSIGKRTKNDD